MSWFDVIDSFAKGTLVEDTERRIVDGLDQFEKLIGSSEKHIENLADNLEKGAKAVVDGADKAVDVASRVSKVIDKNLPRSSTD